MSDAAPGADSSLSFPDFLLEDVLDYLHLEDLLLVAMPVNRHWRQSVIDHRQYWHYLDLNDESPLNHAHLQYDSPHAHTKSVPLFLLRLSRTEGRPISVRIEHADPGAAVFIEVAQHLAHITFLFVHTSPDHVGQLVELFRPHPAPLLASFYLTSWSQTPTSDPVVIPVDMFASAAPRLQHVDLSDVELRHRPQFPAFLANVNSLSYSIVGQVSFQLPNIFLECPRLERLFLQGGIELDDPAFMQASNWARLHQSSFNIFGFEATQLPIGGVRRVTHHAFYNGASVVVNVAQSLTEPLSVAFHSLPELSGRSFTILGITMRSTVKNISHERRIETTLPAQAPGNFPVDTIAAFRSAPLVGSIVRLVLSVSNWDELVGLGYLTAFPALEDLVLTVGYLSPETVWRTPDPESKLSCPRLQRLILRRWRWCELPVIEVAAVASFAGASLPDTVLPLKLELNEVALEGSWKDFPTVFSGYEEREITDVDDNP